MVGRGRSEEFVSCRCWQCDNKVREANATRGHFLRALLVLGLGLGLGGCDRCGSRGEPPGADVGSICQRVEFDVLWSHPGEFGGHRVCVRGVAAITGAHAHLYPQRDEAAAGNQLFAIELSESGRDWFWRHKLEFRGVVTVVGTFASTGVESGGWVLYEVDVVED